MISSYEFSLLSVFSHALLPPTFRGSIQSGNHRLFLYPHTITAEVCGLEKSSDPSICKNLEG